MIRLELGYGLLALAGGDAPRLTEQIKGLRRSIAAEMGFVLPPVRIQDNMQLGADHYSIRIKEIEAGSGELRPTMLLAMDPKGGTPPVPGEPTREPAFGLPALWIDPALKEEAMFRGCTVVDPPSVLTTHLTEVVRENMAELLSYAETQKLLDELPREQQKLVADLIPSQITAGGVQRVLQSLLAERVSIRDLPTILEGIQEACGGAARAIPAIVAHVRARLARQISDSHTGAGGYIPLVTLSAEWETEFAEALTGPAEDRQLAMAPSKLQDFMQKLRTAFDAAAGAGETPVLLTSGGIRSHVRAIVERIRPSTPVLAQAEIHPRATHPNGGDDMMATAVTADEPPYAMRLKLYRAPAMARGDGAGPRRTGRGRADPRHPPRRRRRGGHRRAGAGRRRRRHRCRRADPARLAALDFHGVPAALHAALQHGELADRAGRRVAVRHPAAGPSAPLLLVGPPGAGKTLTVARLATRLVMAGVAPMVITADGKRAGATEQLAAFTRLLGISLIVASHPVTLGRALTRRAEQRAGADRYAGLRSVRPRADGGTDRARRDRRRAPWCWCCPPASTRPRRPTWRSAYVGCRRQPAGGDAARSGAPPRRHPGRRRQRGLALTEAGIGPVRPTDCCRSPPRGSPRAC